MCSGATVQYSTCVDCGAVHGFGQSCDTVTVIPITGSITVRPFNVNAGAHFATPVLFAPTPASVIIAEQPEIMSCLACGRGLAANGACYTCNPIRKYTC